MLDIKDVKIKDNKLIVYTKMRVTIVLHLKDNGLPEDMIRKINNRKPNAPIKLSKLAMLRIKEIINK